MGGAVEMRTDRKLFFARLEMSRGRLWGRPPTHLVEVPSPPVRARGIRSFFKRIIIWARKPNIPMRQEIRNWIYRFKIEMESKEHVQEMRMSLDNDIAIPNGN
jgi:hypothetical protein